MEANLAGQVSSVPEAVGAAALKNLWHWLGSAVKPRRRRLRVCETLSLGERRFVAIIEFDRQEFLVGGSGNSLELLARLEEGKVIAEPSTPRDRRAA
jgi:flagellar biogenesis protein FliO